MRAIKLALEAYKAELGEEADVKIYLEPPTAADISKGYWDVQDDRIYIPQAEGAIGLITCKALAHRAFIKRHPRIKQPCFLGIAILIGLVLILLAEPEKGIERCSGGCACRPRRTAEPEKGIESI